MLFGKKRKRDLRIFKIPENELVGTKIPVRLVVGLLAPFIIVAIFLLLFSRKIDLTTSILKPGLPQASHVPVVSPQSSPNLASVPDLKPPQEIISPPPVAETPMNAPVPVSVPIVPKITQPPVVLHLPAAKVVESEIPSVKVMTPIKVTASPIVAKPVTLKKPVKTLVASTVGRFTIQVGSFPKKEEAEQVASRLVSHGHEAYVVMADIANKGTWYRVRVGHYKDRQAAQGDAEKLAQAEQISFIITAETSNPIPVGPTPKNPIPENPVPAAPPLVEE
jgi:cell division septation protein DedD